MSYDNHVVSQIIMNLIYLAALLDVMGMRNNNFSYRGLTTSMDC